MSLLHIGDSPAKTHIRASRVSHITGSTPGQGHQETDRHQEKPTKEILTSNQPWSALAVLPTNPIVELNQKIEDRTTLHHLPMPTQQPQQDKELPSQTLPPIEVHNHLKASHQDTK